LTNAVCTQLQYLDRLSSLSVGEIEMEVVSRDGFGDLEGGSCGSSVKLKSALCMPRSGTLTTCPFHLSSHSLLLKE
jgi:hypothetical protein